MAGALGKPREDRQDAIEIAARGNRKVLAHGQRREDATPLRHQADPQRVNAIGWQPRDIDALEDHTALARRRQSDKRPAQRRLADAVAAEYRRARALRRLEGDNL